MASKINQHDPDTVLIDNLASMIRHSGKTQRQIETETGVDANNISDWLHFRRKPTVHKLNIVLGAFGCRLGIVRKNDGEN